MKKKILALQNQSQVIFGTPTMDKLPSNAFADGITALRVALNVKVKNGKVTDPARLDNAVRDIVEIITKKERHSSGDISDELAHLILLTSIVMMEQLLSIA